MLRSGVVIANRFVVESLIATGGSSLVYRAQDNKTGARVALKILTTELETVTWNKRFETEVRACARLSHANVVRIHGNGTHAGRPFLVMEHLEGGTLSHRIRRDARIDPWVAIYVASAIGAALRHTHERGLVHRDVKPENIMVDADGRPKLVDFGLAIDRECPRAQRLTSDGAVVGTPEYLSPEQVCGQSVDGRSDIFSLGITLYETFTGLLPFEGTSTEIARKNAFEDAPPMAARNPAARVAPELEALVGAMLTRRRDNRPDAPRICRALRALSIATPAHPPAPTSSPLDREAPVVVSHNSFASAFG